MIVEIAAICGISAAYLLSIGKAYKGHLVLAVVQPTVCLYMIYIEEYALALMNAVYTFTAIKGTFYWKKNGDKK